MTKSLGSLSKAAVFFCAIFLFVSLSVAQDNPEDLKHKPANSGLLAEFLKQYGYDKYQLIERENEKILAFKVQNEGGPEILDFSIMLQPEGQILKFEAHALAQVPTDPAKVGLLLEKLTELNGMRSIGKYCLDNEKQNVRYFYYRTVAGGICYADFRKTLQVIQYIVFNDLKELRDLK